MSNSSISFDTAHIFGSPKSTALGLFILLYDGFRTVNFDAAGHLAMTPRDWFALAMGVCFAVLSAFVQDADRAKAHVPGESDPVDVPGNPVPNDPNLKAAK